MGGGMLLQQPKREFLPSAQQTASSTGNQHKGNNNNNGNLPIRLTLDFSDEKSQNLFIYEQKYNMKKNDCFNLEKQKTALQAQLQHRNSEYERLQTQFKSLKLKYDEIKLENQTNAT